MGHDNLADGMQSIECSTSVSFRIWALHVQFTFCYPHYLWLQQHRTNCSSLYQVLVLLRAFAHTFLSACCVAPWLPGSHLFFLQDSVLFSLPLETSYSSLRCTHVPAWVLALTESNFHCDVDHHSPLDCLLLDAQHWVFSSLNPQETTITHDMW